MIVTIEDFFFQNIWDQLFVSNVDVLNGVGAEGLNKTVRLPI